MVSLKETVSKNIKVLRRRHNYSQAELAKLACVSTGYIGSIETGKKFPSAEVIETLAEALQVRPYRLFQTESDVLSVYSTDQIYAIHASLELTIKETLENTIKDLDHTTYPAV